MLYLNPVAVPREAEQGEETNTVLLPPDAEIGRASSDNESTTCNTIPATHSPTWPGSCWILQECWEEAFPLCQVGCGGRAGMPCLPVGDSAVAENV